MLNFLTMPYHIRRRGSNYSQYIAFHLIIKIVTHETLPSVGNKPEMSISISFRANDY